MSRELQLQLSIEPVQANRRSLRRCYGCGNYERPFVEMDGVIRCERCAKKEADPDGEGGDKSRDGIEAYGLIT
jgi:ribosomal protein S27E